MRLKYLLLLVATQIGCIAVGLWIHYQFVASELYRSAEKEAVAKLGASAEELLGEIGRLGLPKDFSSSAKLDEVDRLFRAKRALPEMQLTFTDSQWKVLATLPLPSTAAAPEESPPQTLAWATPPGATGGPVTHVNGALMTLGERHVALAIRSDGRDGYAVIHYPLERAELATATVKGLLSAAGVMTWIWTSTLLLIPVYLITTRFHDELTSGRAQSEAAALRNVQTLVRTRDAVIFGLAKLAESRDDMTGKHLERISAYVRRFTASVRHHPKYCNLISADFVELIGTSSALHDIGKVGIEDAILLKPGRLTPSERARIEEHASIGGECLLQIERHLGSSNFLQMAREIAWAHHERWDGTGYPRGLAGEQIPLAARIVSIADVYDALATRRTYKEAMPHRECLAMIQEGAGTQFDPDLVEVFLKIEESFRRIALQYGDNAPEPKSPDAEVPDAEVPDAEVPEPERPAWESEALCTLEAVLQQSMSDSADSASVLN